jgi:outer membrane lipoprotein carrier protein
MGQRASVRRHERRRGKLKLAPRRGLAHFWMLALGWVMPSLSAQTVDVVPLLKAIEKRYNSSQTIIVDFAESYTARGRKRTEKGVLYLRKPGKMRWQYTDPPDKLFVSDGRFIYSYFPDERRAEKVRFKETDDMRAPLAFLLGRLNFLEDFREFRASRSGEDAFIVASPKSDRFPYSEVSFLASPDFTIRRLIVKLQDNSVLEYAFANEKRNPPVADALFRFQPPAGVELVDATR